MLGHVQLFRFLMSYYCEPTFSLTTVIHNGREEIGLLSISMSSLYSADLSSLHAVQCDWQVVFCTHT